MIKNTKKLLVIPTPILKLKDSPARRFVPVNLKTQFGFKPDVIIIEKALGINNAFILKAVLTKELEEEYKIKT